MLDFCNFRMWYDFGFTTRGLYATINKKFMSGGKPRLKRKGDCLVNCVRG